MAFLKSGRDVHVSSAGFLLDGGSHYAVLADADGNTGAVIIFSEKRASKEGVVVAAFDRNKRRVDTEGGRTQEAKLKKALVAALKRSETKNPNSAKLLDALDSWTTTYGEDIAWVK